MFLQTVKVTGFLPEETHALRQEVFIEEQGFAQEFDETDRAALHITLYEDGQAAACCRIFPDSPRGTWHVGRVAVRKNRRGQGLGAQVMDQAEAAARARGAARMVLSAQVQAAGFYQKLGYAQSGGVYLDEHCPHVHMEKLLGQETTEKRETACE